MIHNLEATVGATTLSVLSASMTMDETWVPYIQAELTVVAPADPSVLDPRNNARVELTWTATPLGAALPTQTLTADLGVRRWRLGDDGELILSLASDEALAQDYALGSAQESGTFPTVFEFVDAFLSFIGAGVAAGYDNAFLDEPFQYMKAGDVLWSALNPVVQQTGLRLYCDESRSWRLKVAPENSTQMFTIIGRDVTISQEASISRDDDLWADSVVVLYQWTDLTGNTHSDYDSATDSFPPTKTLVIEHKTAYPGAGAARQILNRAQGLGQNLLARVVSDYSVRPGQQFATLDRDGVIYTGHIRAVSWNLDDDTMTIQPRDLEETPSTAWILLPAGEAWQDSAPGIPWTTA